MHAHLFVVREERCNAAVCGRMPRNDLSAFYVVINYLKHCNDICYSFRFPINVYRDKHIGNFVFLSLNFVERFIGRCVAQATSIIYERLNFSTYLRMWATRI